VTCFLCGLDVKDWKLTDNPWIEHAKFNQNCVYLRYIKGSDYIRAVKRLNNAN
jgi:hypothetical protein